VFQVGQIPDDSFVMIAAHSVTEQETEGRDAGFTLIELMVVLLILAILLAIAIPTFLGVTKSANDRASQSNLNSTTNSTTNSTISVAVSTDGKALILAAFSKDSHNCWYIIDNPTPPAPSGPWSGTVTASPSTATGSLVVPSTQGTTYAEAKGDATATDCSASTPKLSGTGAVWQYQTSGFPS
jgi:prepilin-type N-terminal cleavage/methylation domain-containing protein